MSSRTSAAHALARADAVPTHWHILTGEYPPQPGGVSDYTRLVARALAGAGDAVEVWAPPCQTPAPHDSGVTVHRLPDRYGRRSLRLLTQHLDSLQSPQRLLVQYVPHAFGWRAANLPFCAWLASRRSDSVWVMFHEVGFSFEAAVTLPQKLLACANRVMASLVGRAAERAFISIPGWQDPVETVTRKGTPITWLPVPSAIPVIEDASGTAQVRARFGAGRPIVGHFGTYGGLISPMLHASIPSLLLQSDCVVLLMGRGSETARLNIVVGRPELAARVHATGDLDADEMSRHLGACDVMLQPYPDGISGRRTSAMAALAHGRPLVTTSGALTEPDWTASGAAVLVPAYDSEQLAAAVRSLLRDAWRCQDLSRRARTTYAERFELVHTIAALRGAA
jgi:glycosyltransferase involved in cell wall biosynthesis